MTPEERRELAERLVERADRIDLDIIERAIPIVPRAEEWSLTLRRAAAALREDADMGQRASDELLRACEAERERDELRERLADAVVVPRSAIPDGLLRRVKHERHGSRALTVDDLVWVYAALNGRAEEAAARLLSGGATEGDER